MIWLYPVNVETTDMNMHMRGSGPSNRTSVAGFTPSFVPCFVFCKIYYFSICMDHNSLQLSNKH